MVRLGDFQIQLVDACSKRPFPTYRHHERVYVQMPRGTEFFIALDKPSNRLYSGRLLVRLYHNDRYLGCNLTYQAAQTATEPKYRGWWQRRADGVSTTRALRFARQEDIKQSMDKVKVRIYPALERQDDDSRTRYDRHCLLATLTLHVGSASELCQQGVQLSPTRGGTTTVVQEKLNQRSTHKDDPPILPQRRDAENAERQAEKKYNDDDDDDDSVATNTDPAIDWGSFVMVDPDMDVIVVD